MNDENPRDPLLTNLSVASMGAGALLLLFVLMETFSVYKEPQTNRFISAFTSFVGDGVLLGPPEKPITLGPAGTKLAAFIVFLGFAALGAKVSISLMRLGFHGFAPDVREKWKELKQRLDELQSKRN